MSESRKKGEQSLVVALVGQTLRTTSLHGLRAFYMSCRGVQNLFDFETTVDTLELTDTSSRFFGYVLECMEFKIVVRTKIS